jgi:site-specific DNA-methyltransferase (adenine-specific)
MIDMNSTFQTCRVFHGDCVEGMKNIPAQSVDLVITDPPFGIEFKAKKENYNRKESRVLGGYNEVHENNYLTFTRNWMSEVKRVLKGSGSMFVFSGWNNLKDILITLDELGFITVNHLIWKYQFGVVTSRKFVTSHYHCLFVCLNDEKRKFFPYCRFDKDEKSKDGSSLSYKDREDVWVINREYWNGDIKTPTKLPAEIIRKILAYTSEKGDVVLDPFLGSGQVAVVSKMEGRQYIGFEIVKEYYDFVNERLTTDQYRIKAEIECNEAQHSTKMFPGMALEL